MNVGRWAYGVGGAAGAGGAGLFILISCAAPKLPLGDPQAEIAQMLAHSAANWNAGDLAAFMSDYARDSLTSYVTGGHVQYGWQPLYDHYQATYFAPGKTRDSLTFEEVRVRPLTLDLALCTARFALHRGGADVAIRLVPLYRIQRCNLWRRL